MIAKNKLNATTGLDIYVKNVWGTSTMTDELPCEGKGWGFPAAHCAPPVGYKDGGYACDGCPWTRAERYDEPHVLRGGMAGGEHQ